MRLFRLVRVIPILALLFVAQDPASAARQPRTEEHIYNGSRGDSSGTSETNLQEMIFSTQPGEKWILVEIDDSYRDDDGVLAHLEQDVDGDGRPEYSYDLCGRSDKPLRIEAGPDVLVRVEVANGCEGPVGASSGKVAISYFRNKRSVARYLRAAETASERTARDDEAAYVWGGGAGAGPVTLPPSVLFDSPTGGTIGGAVFKTGTDDRFVSLKIADAAGLPVRAAIYTGPHGRGQYVADVCGSTKDSIELPPDSQQLIVYVLQGPCADGTPAAVTQGTISATFSNVP